MFKKSKILVAGILMGLQLCFLMLPLTVSAAGVTKIMLSGSPQAGSDFKVTVEGTESGDKIVINFASGLSLKKVSGINVVNGNTVTIDGSSATLTFQAASAGNYDIIAGGSKNSKSSVKVSVAGQSSQTSQNSQSSQTAQNAQSSQTAQNAQSSQTSQAQPQKTTASEQFNINGVGYTTSEKFQNSEIPAGFTVKRVAVGNYNYKMVSNGSITLIYLKPASDITSPGKFYLYDESAKLPSDLIMLGDLSKYVIVVNDAEGTEGLGQSTLNVNSLSVPVFTSNGESYVYGYDETGAASWFKVNSDGSYEKSDAPQAIENTDNVSASKADSVDTNTKKESPSSWKDKLSSLLKKARGFFASLLDNRRNLLIFIDILAVVLLIVVIVMIRRATGRDDSNPFSEDDEEKDESFFEEAGHDERPHEEAGSSIDIKENETREISDGSEENKADKESDEVSDQAGERDSEKPEDLFNEAKESAVSEADSPESEDKDEEDGEDGEDEADEEYQEDGEETGDDERLGLFARMRREKKEEKEWKDLSEMDLKDFSSRIHKENHPIAEKKSSEDTEKEKTESEKFKELQKEIHDNSAKKNKDIDFIDFNKL